MYHIVDLSPARTTSISCGTLDESRQILEERILSGSTPCFLHLFRGERVPYHYQNKVNVIFEGEAAVP